MNPFVQALIENHKAFGMPILHTPTIPMHRAKMRIGLIEEEADELFQACFREESIVDAADALVDLLYVVVGAMLEFGLTDIVYELFNEVQRSNMSKLGKDGKPIYREDGKYLKGPNYSPPNLAAIINKVNKQLELFNGDE
jgi:predicted HAD superfamily Cof-like phosphohydrolase